MERSSVSARAQLSAEVTPPPGYERHKLHMSVKKVEKYNANGKKAGECDFSTIARRTKLTHMRGKKTLTRKRL